MKEQLTEVEYSKQKIPNRKESVCSCNVYSKIISRKYINVSTK